MCQHKNNTFMKQTKYFLYMHRPMIHEYANMILNIKFLQTNEKKIEIEYELQ